MLKGNLKECAQVCQHNSDFQTAMDYLKQLKKFPELGEHEIDGNRIYASAQEYDTIPLNEIPWEFHQKYVDIQYIYSGRETVGVTDAAQFDDSSYDAERDIALSHEDIQGEKVELLAGEFVILFPKDAHRPCGNYRDSPEQVQKLVVKVRISG